MLSFFQRDVLDEIWDLIESVSVGFPTYSFRKELIKKDNGQLLFRSAALEHSSSRKCNGRFIK